MEKLAIEGGTPVRKEKLPLIKPYITEDEVSAVSNSVRSGWISSNGPNCKALEEEMAKYLKIKHVILVNSCTSALHLAMMINNIENADVIVPDYTFTSTALAPILNNSYPVLIDVQPDTANIDTSLLNSVITRKTKAIIPVHYAGQPADMDEINEFASKHSLYVVEDAAQALGSKYKGKYAGTLSDVSCFSFHAAKNVTAGEGGAVATNNDKLAEKARIMRDKGTNRFKGDYANRLGFYEYVSKGHNFMFSDVLASIALAQFRKIDKINRLRTEIATKLSKHLSKFDKIQLPKILSHNETNWHIYAIRVPKEKLKFFIEAMNAEGINANIHYLPLHINPYYQELGYKNKTFPGSMKVYETMIRLPIHPAMSDKDVQDIIHAVEKIHPHL